MYYVCSSTKTLPSTSIFSSVISQAPLGHPQGGDGLRVSGLVGGVSSLLAQQT